MNAFDNIKHEAHAVCESSMLKATRAGHIYNVKVTEDADNGTIVALGKLVEMQVFEAETYAAGKTPLLLLTPPLAYNGKRGWSDEKYFYNAKDEIARAYELHEGDIYTLSKKAFGEGAAVGKLIDATYAVVEEAGDGFVGEIIEEVPYADTVAYRVLVRKIA